MKHSPTPTPWEILEPANSRYATVSIYGQNRTVLIAQVQPERYAFARCLGPDYPNEDAVHIVACVNQHDSLIQQRDELAEALKTRQRKGHHDTCSHALSEEYACDCGYEQAEAALRKAGKL